MCEFISFGEFNKKYFFILGSITVRLIIIFIYGVTPYLTPNDTIYIFGFKSSFFSHPLISYCFQYFSMILGGIILHIIYTYKNKSAKNITEEESVDEEKDKIFNNINSEGIIQKEMNKIEEMNDKKYIKRIFLIFAVYFFSQIANNSLNQLGFNRVKFWSLESIFLYIFSKKILNKIMYKHQKTSILAMIICCTLIYLANSLLPYDNKDCSNLPDVKKKECQIINQTVYNDITNKLGWYFIPIIIIIYLLGMIGNSFSTVSTKWLMDIKYITFSRILLYIGVVGFVCSIIVLFTFSNIPCKSNDLDNNICRFKYEGQNFYDNYKILGQIAVDPNIVSNFYKDIFIIIPLFVISSFLHIFFELLIIVNLDPFYLIPIDCVIYFIIEIVIYIKTYSISNKYANIKFALQLLSNGFSIFLLGIYLEIIELHFWNLDLFLRRFIIKREIKDKNCALIKDDNDDVEVKSDDQASIIN